MKPPRHWGIRGRLLLAFGCIAAVTVVATVVAWLSFAGLSETIDQIVSDNLPTVTLASTLAERSGLITATAPTLATARSDEDRGRARDTLSRSLREVDMLLRQLDARVIGSEATHDLRVLITDLEANLRTLDTNVGRRLEYQRHRVELTNRFRFAYEDFLDEINPLLDDAHYNIEFALQQAREGTNVNPNGGQRDELHQEIRTQEALQGILADVNYLVGLIGLTGTLGDAEAISEARWLFRRKSTGPFDANLQLIAPLPESLSLVQSIEDIRSYAEGDKSLFALRIDELATLEEGRRLVEENRQLIARLQQLVTQRVQVGNVQTRTLAEASRDGIREGKLALLIASIVSLGVAVLVVWLYVGRSIVARLTALSDSMLAIAGGDLEAEIPTSGRDEIGAMADALTVFRDAARTRLVDAIETLQEGFALYDADDRLVLCNSRYRELLYPGLGDIMTPGTPFETVVRTAATRGLIRDAQGCEEAWVRERLAKHHAPSGPHLQERSDGRWIQINERKTDVGGIVAVYSDITALKRSQLEAEEANQAKSDFLRAVDHDAKNHLNHIISYIGLVRDTSTDRLEIKQSENLVKALASANELTAILMAIDKYLKGLPPEPKMTRLAPLLDECLSVVELMLRKGVASIKEIEPELPPLWVDPFMLKRIVSNLLSNAVKCTTQGAIVTSARRIGETVEIAVRDTGCGIPAEDLDRIFNKDVQLRPERGGSGLGLTICKDFAERIGGTISVESKVDVGSTFTVTMPLHDSAPASWRARVGAT
jgi:signal transduction histidine kinase/HAMP domain-containing protein